MASLAFVGVLGCRPAPGLRSSSYSADGSAVFGTDQRIKATYKDTLLDIARRYSLGYEEIIRANPSVDMWLPGEGTEILPAWPADFAAWSTAKA